MEKTVRSKGIACHKRKDIKTVRPANNMEARKGFEL